MWLLLSKINCASLAFSSKDICERAVQPSYSCVLLKNSICSIDSPASLKNACHSSAVQDLPCDGSRHFSTVLSNVSSSGSPGAIQSISRNIPPGFKTRATSCTNCDILGKWWGAIRQVTRSKLSDANGSCSASAT